MEQVKNATYKQVKSLQNQSCLQNDPAKLITQQKSFLLSFIFSSFSRFEKQSASSFRSYGEIYLWGRGPLLVLPDYPAQFR